MSIRAFWRWYRAECEMLGVCEDCGKRYQRCTCDAVVEINSVDDALLVWRRYGRP
jgi:DTW domain-containing protein YfiP